VTPSAQLRIFISYARKDGTALAQRLQSDLAKQGFDVWLDTQRLRGGAVWSVEIEREVDTRQVTIALLSPGSYASEICRAEQVRALDKGHRVIPVLAVNGTERPLYLYARQYRDFTDEAKYASRLAELLSDIRGHATATLPDNYRKTRVTYLTSPPRVANYLERPDALRALRDAVFAEDHRQPIALTALAGMGGIGKTVLAQALTRDDVVQQAFPDGVVWIAADRTGRKDFVEQMREVAKALGDDPSHYENALACENAYRTIIARKAALIVVDDVWSIADIDPLLAESPHSRFLFTTRDISIGRFVGAREHRLELLDREQSRKLLASWAGLKEKHLPDEAEAIISECGQLPLALSVIGAMLRDADPLLWSDTLELLRKVDLSAIQEQLPAGQDSFFRAVEVSFHALVPKMQERYKALAVLVEDMAAPLQILETLWNANESDARRTSRQLVDRCLAHEAETDGGIRLHDLHLDYLRAHYPDREALELIRKAARLSTHVIEIRPWEFASQLIGRLLPYEQLRTIERFMVSLSSGAPTMWLRSLLPALDPPGTPLMRTLEGHSSWVCAVAVTRDGRRAISASDDWTLIVWDLETGRQLRTLRGHKGSVTAVAITADGRRAVSASYDKTLKVWDLETGRELRTLQGHTCPVQGVAVIADGRVISTALDLTLRIWDLGTSRTLRKLEGHTQAVNAVAVSGDGRRAVSASDDNTLRLWDLDTGRTLQVLEGHAGSVSAVAMLADAHRAISASHDKTLKIWDLQSGRELLTLRGHAGPIQSVAVTADGRRAVSASHDKTLRVWDLDTGRTPHILKGHADPVYGAAVSADGRLAVSACEDTTLKIWSLETASAPHPLEAHADAVHCVAASADGHWAVSGSDDTTLKIWNLATRLMVRTMKAHDDTVYGVAINANGQWIASGSADETVRVWDVRTGREVRVLEGHAGSVYAVAMSVDGRRVASASRDGTVRIWNVETGRVLLTLGNDSDGLHKVAISPGLGRAFSVSYSWHATTSKYEIRVWDLETGRQIRTLEGCERLEENGVALSADGRRIVSVAEFWAEKGDSCRLKVWEVETGQALRTLSLMPVSVTAVAVDANGRNAVFASTDQILRVWNLDTGNLLATFTCDGQAHSCTFVSDRKLIIGDTLGRVHFLQLEDH
jgi:WD40 repeat protein